MRECEDETDVVVVRVRLRFSQFLHFAEPTAKFKKTVPSNIKIVCLEAWGENRGGREG